MSGSIPADVISRLAKFEEVISQIEEAVDEIDVGVDKHYEVSIFIHLFKVRNSVALRAK